MIDVTDETIDEKSSGSESKMATNYDDEIQRRNFTFILCCF
jgi:hypothetical protein